ncbi:MAG TPA: DUF1446 domain-containing protein [Thermoanaerobaculaceae bacterium]|nr:DUF1446 domain-containing protein [Thermoanaerobaculaceae bacterium]HRS15247.1 DUF1446 domain-containing protein [Thermoanaerobaculaceae bacterium]
MPAHPPARSRVESRDPSPARPARGTSRLAGGRPPDILRIGNAGGYWGDDPAALRRQLCGPLRLDYVSIDFLAELSMSILQKQRARDPAAGWARDFLAQVGPLLGELRARGTRIITNAGGVNPRGCAEALCAAARAQGLPLRVAVVSGDDVLSRVPVLLDSGEPMASLDTGEPLAAVADRLVAANAYFGALPVQQALRHEPDIVVCGRVTDTGITLGAMMYAFGWRTDDWDRLAAGIVAGHIIECGAQVTGGNFTDWQKVTSWEEFGYPVLECHPDGSFIVTKQPGTGGLVSCATVREQLLYEMGEPEAYLTPDCIADFTSIRLEADGPDRVRVSGVVGRPPTPYLKVSAAYADGFKTSGTLIVSGPDARAKAWTFATVAWARLDAELAQAGLGRPEATHTELVGDDSCHGRLTPVHTPSEILLRLSLRDPDRRPLEVFRKLLPSLILSGPAGVAVTGGAPQISEVVSYWPCLIPRAAALPEIEVWEQPPGGAAAHRAWESGPIPWPVVPPSEPRRKASRTPRPAPLRAAGRQLRVPLLAIAHARSGDKGDTANIGLIGRSEACFAWLARHLTASRVRQCFTGLVHGGVRRHLVPNLWAVNFLLEKALGGGGTRSLRLDAQGKTLAQALLRCEVTIPAALLRTIAPENRPCAGELLPAGRRTPP